MSDGLRGADAGADERTIHGRTRRWGALPVTGRHAVAGVGRPRMRPDAPGNGVLDAEPRGEGERCEGAGEGRDGADDVCAEAPAISYYNHARFVG